MKRAVAVLATELGSVLEEKAVRHSLPVAHTNGMQYFEYKYCYLSSVYCCAVDYLPNVTSSCGNTFHARNSSKVVIAFPLFKQKQTNSGSLVRQRTIPTERPPLVGEDLSVCLGRS
jgi:hypothetical protein